MASLISLSDSSFDASRKPQVLMTIASASCASGVMARPFSASRPSMRSLSTRFFGQPRLTKATDRMGLLLAGLAMDDSLQDSAGMTLPRGRNCSRTRRPGRMLCYVGDRPRFGGGKLEQDHAVERRHPERSVPRRHGRRVGADPVEHP